MDYFVYVSVFVFGTIVGSFLNVVVLRYGTGQSIVKGGSKCFSCGEKLKWYEIVPMFSFLAQKGKCKSCRSKISWQYPAVEIITGVLFVFVFWRILNFPTVFGISLEFWISVFSFWLLVALLIIIVVYDIRHFIIPNLFVWFFNILALLFVFFEFLNLPARGWSALGGEAWPNLLSGVLFAAFFALLWFVSKGKWMGFGDAKLALGLGWISGPLGTVSVFLFSFWLGAIVGIFLLFCKRFNLTIKSRIPFAPFLVAGFLIHFLFDFNIVDLLSLF